MRVYTGANQFDQAEEHLAKRRDLNPDAPNLIRLDLDLVRARIGRVQNAITRRQYKGLQGLLVAKEPNAPTSDDELIRAELDNYINAAAELFQKLFDVRPDALTDSDISNLCNTYISQNKIAQAKDFIDKYLALFPDDRRGLYYKRLLAEPDPANISEEKRKEIDFEAISSTTYPAQRAFDLGMLYRNYDEPNNAIAAFAEVLEIESLETDPAEVEKIAELQDAASRYLFELSIQKQDWDSAQQIVDLARTKNFDRCEGNFFAGRIAEARGQYKEALLRLDECIRQRPAFSHAHMLRSNIHSALGNDHKAIEDARRARYLSMKSLAWAILFCDI